MDYKYPTPQLLFKAICDAIRAKTGSNNKIIHQNIPDELDSIIIDEEEYNIEMQRFIDIIEGTSFAFVNDRITTVKGALFYKFTNLTTIDLLKCTSIGNQAFYSCKSLTTIDLPKCTNIEYDAFRSCTSLTTVNFPECTSIGFCTFYGCTNLTTVNLPECTSIKDHAFEGCTNLTTVNLPKCTTLGSTAFGSCKSLATVNLPNCTTIEDEAFNKCTSLTTINLPECTSIGDRTFSYCTNLVLVVLGVNQIVTLGGDHVFNNTTTMLIGRGYIYVPDNLVDSYKTATNWSTYANQIKPISELPSELKEEYGYA